MSFTNLGFHFNMFLIFYIFYFHQPEQLPSLPWILCQLLHRLAHAPKRENIGMFSSFFPHSKTFHSITTFEKLYIASTGRHTQSYNKALLEPPPPIGQLKKELFLLSGLRQFQQPGNNMLLPKLLVPSPLTRSYDPSDPNSSPKATRHSVSYLYQVSVLGRPPRTGCTRS